MTTLLEAEQICVEFGTLVAVRDASFTVDGGQLVGLVGPNGAGKTTLLRVLAGLHVPTRGVARIMDKPVLGEHEVVRHHVGFAPDAPPAYEELTILQFLRFIARAYGLDRELTSERIDFWLEQLWLVDKSDTLVKHLSRGMRQRLTLARTFLPQPHVLLLDEPLAGLDPAGRIELRRVLGMLREQGCAMVVSSHILADLEEVASHIAIIEEGSIIRWDTIGAIAHGTTERRIYEVVTLEDSPACHDALLAIDGVSHVSRDGRTVQFDYAADERETADLLRRLVASDVGVVSFSMVKTSLEEAYLRAGVKQVD